MQTLETNLNNNFATNLETHPENNPEALFETNPQTNPENNPETISETNLKTNPQNNLETNLQTNLENNLKTNFKTNPETNSENSPETNIESTQETNIETIIRELYLIGAIKLGEFTLKNGSVSPIYIDLRQIISAPDLLRLISEVMWEKIRATRFDLICGVPYTALPIATCISLFHNIPMIMRRKEKKLYGTKQILEGKFTPAQTCLLIEDVITSGASILETADDLEAAGLIIRDVVVFIDREESGKNTLQKRNYQIYPVLTLSELMPMLLRLELLKPADRAQLIRFVETGLPI
jgi:orotate phosphoribosyltransferase